MRMSDEGNDQEKLLAFVNDLINIRLPLMLVANGQRSVTKMTLPGPSFVMICLRNSHVRCVRATGVGCMTQCR